MKHEKTSELQKFVEKKRKEKQPDELILEELVAAGWDRGDALRALAGDDVPRPEPRTSPDKTAPTTQTGAPGTPLQVENVQYNVNVGKVRSKIGLAATISSLFGWILAFVLMGTLLTLRAMAFPDSGDSVKDPKENLVVAIAVLIPLLPIWLYAVKRMNLSLLENPVNADDVYFKKSIRFHFFVSLIATFLWAFVLIYNVLARVLLNKTEITNTILMNTAIFFIPLALLTYFFFSYQKLTKR